MPHIHDLDKIKYNHITHSISSSQDIETKGDLEYLVYQLIKRYMHSREVRYSNLHDAVYATIHAGEEYKRLYLDKREDVAIEQNGEA